MYKKKGRSLSCFCETVTTTRGRSATRLRPNEFEQLTNMSLVVVHSRPFRNDKDKHIFSFCNSEQEKKVSKSAPF